MAPPQAARAPSARRDPQRPPSLPLRPEASPLSLPRQRPPPGLTSGTSARCSLLVRAPQSSRATKIISQPALQPSSPRSSQHALRTTRSQPALRPSSPWTSQHTPCTTCSQSALEPSSPRCSQHALHPQGPRSSQHPARRSCPRGHRGSWQPGRPRGLWGSAGLAPVGRVLEGEGSCIRAGGPLGNRKHRRRALAGSPASDTPVPPQRPESLRRPDRPGRDVLRRQRSLTPAASRSSPGSGAEHWPVSLPAPGAKSHWGRGGRRGWEGHERGGW